MNSQKRENRKEIEAMLKATKKPLVYKEKNCNYALRCNLDCEHCLYNLKNFQIHQFF
jgi:sulfatase maturation enzyme AslB (radical SAM superfamily)